MENSRVPKPNLQQDCSLITPSIQEGTTAKTYNRSKQTSLLCPSGAGSENADNCVPRDMRNNERPWS